MATKKDRKAGSKKEKKNYKSDKSLSNIFPPQSDMLGNKRISGDFTLNSNSSKDIDNTKDSADSSWSKIQNIPPDLLKAALDSPFLKFKEAMNINTTELKHDLRKLGERLKKSEELMENLTLQLNIQNDQIKSLEKQMEEIEAKPVEMEGRARRCNIRIRGNPEHVMQIDLKKYLTEFLTFLELPPNKEVNFLEQFHRVPTVVNRNINIPRDVLICCHT
ncbi:Hypothetical predicted protein [Pelobates cultripes]|uniref:Uncharacterized protein n=1 Tax=Pelobates cultripes TaxID=61616 RepID=A0AAD1R780_PELCU|nr:Hypothetical predicted protein [Pelobates cultripes]